MLRLRESAKNIWSAARSSRNRDDHACTTYLGVMSQKNRERRIV